MRLLLPGCKTLHLLLLNLITFLLNGSTAFRSLMKMLNKTRSSINPWGTQLVTGLQPDSALLIQPSKFCQSAINPPHCPLMYPTFSKFRNKDVLRDNVKCLAEAKYRNLYKQVFRHLTLQMHRSL
ncbi:28S ribosomal protein S36, mitochondrial isoform X1 [Gallus gallus]|uniref:28S ribosomal protein S36, mitochondrial isoform X1 n=1 Tax=Gallus gallus TaxID=9031 RepID=UPI001AE1819B|nr:28S ribosomal protein S36, mitochondrial isoform X1 [Gallus gallus]XP_046792421.1 28S ribosomal protein S36, mitochondrial isoform X1 [Gallus gallus]